MTDTLLIRTPSELGDLCFICSCQKYIECYLPAELSAESTRRITSFNNESRVTVYRGKNALLRQFDLLDNPVEKDKEGHKKVHYNKHFFKTLFIHTKKTGLITTSTIVSLPAVIPLNYYLHSTGNPDEYRITVTFDKCFRKREFEVLSVII